MSAVLLVVEDEPGISLPLTDRLRREGYEVRLAEDGERGLALARADDVDLVLLDLMLPLVPGERVLETLRAEGRDVPVICLTARTGEADRVGRLDDGADDYVTKPFSLDELVSRVRAVLRRSSGRGAAARGTGAAPAAPPLLLDGAEVDLDGHVVRRDGREVRLSALEASILRCLAERRGRSTSRALILERVWGPLAAVTDRTIDFHVKNLRRKVERDATKPRVIVTDHGVGYRLA